MLEHGGRLRAAAARYGIPLEAWVDLSTGINPHGWPVPALPAAAWARLPEPDDGLVEAARAYYGAGSILPVAGSQPAIQALPTLRPPARVGILALGYAEHPHAWERAGHSVLRLAADEIEDALDAIEVLVAINPNNPTGHRFAREDLLRWRARLAARGGWLVVDEAFMDATPGESLAPLAHLPALIVLRSLGKFFGLAGARVGFVLAEPALLARMGERLGPWAVAGPSRHIALQALQDRPWQAAMRAQLPHMAQRLADLLATHGLAPSGGTALFQWVRTARAPHIHEHLARQGILTRLFAEPASLRFGLPADEGQWRRFGTALEGMTRGPA